ncbi:UNVERIFIED_CONTAM: hypothetical protein Sradi_5809800 [Sesamum radiatum]|uniref:Uncharacterized protein n=1 Tax=Sesamum radiatum TaxID=300843 RepID=A0AAW2KP09_SESRA
MVAPSKDPTAGKETMASLAKIGAGACADASETAVATATLMEAAARTTVV